MRFSKKILATGISAGLAVVAFFGVAAQFSTWHETSYRLFSFWVILSTSLYFLVNTFWLLFRSPNDTHPRFIAPRLGLIIIANNLIVLFTHIVNCFVNLDLPTVANGFGEAIICYLVPSLSCIFWLVFCQKGTMRLADPFYFLMLGAIYGSFIIISAYFMTSSEHLLYPYKFLDYETFGALNLLYVSLIFMSCILAGGYVLFFLDFAMSGKLSRYIVLPKIKTVEYIEAPKPSVVFASETKTKAKAKANKAGSAGRTLNDVVRILPNQPTSKTRSAQRTKPFATDNSQHPDIDSKPHAKKAQRSQKASPTSQSQAKPETPTKSRKKQKLANVGKLQPIVNQESDNHKDKKVSQKAQNSAKNQKSRLAKASQESTRDANHANKTTKDTKNSQTKNTSKNTSEKHITTPKMSQDSDTSHAKKDKTKFQIPTEPTKQSPKSHTNKNNRNSVVKDNADGPLKNPESEFHLPTKESISQSDKKPAKDASDNQAHKNTTKPQNPNHKKSVKSEKTSKAPTIRHF